MEADSELWKIINSLLPTEQERRVAYLIFYCGLKPREIVKYTLEEFTDTFEIYRLRRKILDRLMRNVGTIRRELSDGEK